MVTVAVFLLFPLVMSGPLVAEGLPWSDALFEAISGMTTTGLSTLGSLEGRSQTFLLARAWMQWVGGLGFVVLSLALIFDPEAGIRPLDAGMLEPSNVVCSLRLHARRALGVYLALTGLGVVTLALLGAKSFDAIVDTLAAVSTGGFAPRDASLVGRSVGYERVVTRIDDEEFEHVAIELGLSDTVIPARTIGRFLADLETSGALKGDARILLAAAREEEEGPLAALALPEKARVSHLYRDGALLFPGPGFEIKKGDELVVVTHRPHVEELRKRWAPRPEGQG